MTRGEPELVWSECSFLKGCMSQFIWLSCVDMGGIGLYASQLSVQQLCAFILIDYADANILTQTHTHALTHTHTGTHMQYTHLCECGHALCQQQSDPNRIDVRLFHTDEHWEQSPCLPYLSARQLDWVSKTCSLTVSPELLIDDSDKDDVIIQHYIVPLNKYRNLT